MEIGFDHERYIEAQSRYILERVKDWDKLYLEFGGKLMYDMHAKRVLPGYRENAKLELLSTMKEHVEIIICVHSGAIANNKQHGDFGTTYENEVLRLIDDLRSYGLLVNGVLITRDDGQPAVQTFRRKLQRRDIRTYSHGTIKGYPSDVDTIVSDEGYGSQEFIPTTRPIVVVTGPGPGSGKLATCLSQLYHEQRRGVRAGYAKFETFPVWNLPLKHPLNLAYEAATADLMDSNVIDSFHLEAYGQMAVNYNRDMEMFPVVRRIIERITGKESVYKSPTDMGVNQIAYGIVNNDVVEEASRQEIIRRYFKASCDYKTGTVSADVVDRISVLMQQQELKPEDRSVVLPARQYTAEAKKRLGDAHGISGVAIQLPDGRMATGRNGELMSAPAAAILNAIKMLSGLPDNLYLLPPIVIEPILDLKVKRLKNRDHVLGCEEILMALAISAVTSPTSQQAFDCLSQLDGCQAHSSVIVGPWDSQIYGKLGMDLTCDSKYLTDTLYYR